MLFKRDLYVGKKKRHNKSLKRDISCFIFHAVFYGTMERTFPFRYLAEKKLKPKNRTEIKTIYYLVLTTVLFYRLVN